MHHSIYSTSVSITIDNQVVCLNSGPLQCEYGIVGLELCAYVMWIKHNTCIRFRTHGLRNVDMIVVL